MGLLHPVYQNIYLPINPAYRLDRLKNLRYPILGRYKRANRCTEVSPLIELLPSLWERDDLHIQVSEGEGKAIGIQLMGAIGTNWRVSSERDELLVMREDLVWPVVSVFAIWWQQ